MRQSKGSSQADLEKAIAHRNRGNSRQAENILKRLIKRDAKFAAGHHQLGSLYQTQGNLKRAVQSLELAVRLEPGSARFQYDFGNVLKALNRHGEAIAAYEEALKANDRVAEIHNNLGTTLLTIGDAARAASCFDRAIELNPTLFQPHLNIGNVYRDRGEFESAIECYRRAIALNPEATEAHNNLGHAFLGLKDSDRAIQCFEKALEIDPDLYEANANLKYQQDLICDWRDFDTRNALLNKHTATALAAGRTPPVTPFQQLSRSADPSLCLQVAKAWSTGYASRALDTAQSAPSTSQSNSGGKIRVGFLSADFGDHPVGQMVARLFEHHDRSRFHIAAYSIGDDDESDCRARIKRTCDEFIELRDASDTAAANRIRDDRIDILIDLMGFTDGYRMGILAQKPAPIQAAYLGFPGTTGAPFLQYLIADSTVCPPDSDDYYSENIVRLPDSYMFCPYGDIDLGPKPTREDAGLSDNQFVFCSFNQMYKIDPRLFDSWMGILRAVDNGVLWFHDRGPRVRDNLRREAESRGISAERLIFAAYCADAKAHLSRLRLADLALDTWLYNGHATTIDALFAGVPVITVPNRHFPSRVATSILQAAGFEDLVCRNVDEYQSMSIELAEQPERLQDIRDRILEVSRNYPLFDPAKFVKNIESAFAAIWRNHLSGKDPAAINIS